MSNTGWELGGEREYGLKGLRYSGGWGYLNKGQGKEMGEERGVELGMSWLHFVLNQLCVFSTPMIDTQFQCLCNFKV